MQDRETTQIPGPADAATRDYRRVEAAIAYLRDHRSRQPNLAELADFLGLGESRLQRLFSRWAGVSPKRFLQYLTVEHVKRRMDETADLFGLSLQAGLSGPGRLHDLFVTMEAMSPGEFRRAAAGVEIRFGIADSPFGPAEVAWSARGVCHLAFLDGDPRPLADSAGRFGERWPDARLQHDPGAAAALLQRVFGDHAAADARPLSVWVSGSNFQVQVWRALLAVPSGHLLNYRQLAQLAGRPGAARAVGTAMAHNPVAYLIPCHRVLRANGEFGIYHWGETRKQVICGWEAAQARSPVAG